MKNVKAFSDFLTEKNLSMVTEAFNLTAEQKKVESFVNKIAKEFDYTNKDAARFIIDTLRKMGLNESFINEKKVEIKVSLKHIKGATELFDDIFKPYGKKEASDSFMFNNSEGAHDFVKILVNRMQIPVGEITMPEGLI